MLAKSVKQPMTCLSALKIRRQRLSRPLLHSMKFTATVRQTADGAIQANQSVTETRREAEESGEVVRRAVDAMNAIDKSSEQISQIIGVDR